MIVSNEKFYKQTRERSLDGKHLFALTKRSLNASIVTTLVTLSRRNVQQRDTDKRIRETHLINIKAGSKRSIKGFADKDDGILSQKPEISVLDDNSSEHSTCQSNDSEGSCGNTSEHSFETESESLSVQNEMSKSRLEVTNERVVSELQEVEPSCAKHVKTPRQPLKDKETHKVNRKNWNDMMERELGESYSFTKKKCFVCGSLSHLIKDYDYYEKKMAREAEVKRVVSTGNRVAKPVWTNANRINHANQFVPRSVQLNASRPKFNSVRPHINVDKTNISFGRSKVNTVSPKVNTVRPRQPAPHKTSNSLSP
ncbi:hypothetical protein Tco_0921274, partial [Tanacetum coccineum]